MAYKRYHSGNPNFYRNSKYDKIYVWETVPVEEQDRGANDEGYYYTWCPYCAKRTEHDCGECLNCNSGS